MEGVVALHGSLQGYSNSCKTTQSRRRFRVRETFVSLIPKNGFSQESVEENQYGFTC